jgi:hypothetical protein
MANEALLLELSSIANEMESMGKNMLRMVVRLERQVDRIVAKNSAFEEGKKQRMRELEEKK